MTKKGFSLIELMVVITIIWILTLMIVSFDFNKKTDMEKRDRLAQKITSILHSSKITMMSGKGVKSGTSIINPDSARMSFGSGSIGLYYYSGSTIVGTWEVMNSPFYQESWYAINNIYSQDKNMTTLSGSLPMDIIFDDSGDISFSGGIPASHVIVWMGVNFKASQSILEFDRRFGTITIK